MEEVQNQKTSEKRSKNQNIWLWRVLFTICAVGAVLAIGSLVYRTIHRNHVEQLLEQLADQTDSDDSAQMPQEESVMPEPVETDEPVVKKTWEQLTLKEKNQLLEEYFGIEIPDKNIDFSALQEEINPDIYAWIYIPNTLIDYPVLQHLNDNAYYLNYNIDGTKGYPGCIYTENYNAKDFTDRNTVIYGHNMKNGTMFGALHQYEDNDFFTENPYVYIYTTDEVYVYRVFAAYEFSDIHLLGGYDMVTEVGFGKYLEEVMKNESKNGNFDRDIEVTAKDKIITLSTCVSKKPKNRYLVQGVLLRIEEEVDSSFALGEAE